MSPTKTIKTPMAPITYQKLGVRTVINCKGTFTKLSGSLLLEEVSQAMVLASNSYVVMDELMYKVGENLAKLFSVDWGYISGGCAAALSELTAACLSQGDPEKMVRLPDTNGMKSEVIMQTAHRIKYDQAIRLAGARIIEVVTEQDLIEALNERTAMLFSVGSKEEFGEISIKRMIELGHKHGIPSIVDAAAERPDIPNRYLALGADAVAYSGGKCLRGPQDTGLVLGRKALLWTAYLNGAPNYGIGRPMKASKEGIMGLLTAAQSWVLARDHKAEWEQWEQDLDTIKRKVERIPGLFIKRHEPGRANVAPTLELSWAFDQLHCTPSQLYEELLANEPPIVVDLRTNGIVIMPYMMEAGEAEIVGTNLRCLLLEKRKQGPSPRTSDFDLSGRWKIRIFWHFKTLEQMVEFQQIENQLLGDYQTQYSTSKIQGSAYGDEINFSVSVGFQSNFMDYVFIGTVESAQEMSGTVTLADYGSCQWEAWRID